MQITSLEWDGVQKSPRVEGWGYLKLFRLSKI